MEHCDDDEGWIRDHVANHPLQEIAVQFNRSIISIAF